MASSPIAPTVIRVQKPLPTIPPKKAPTSVDPSTQKIAEEVAFIIFKDVPFVLKHGKNLGLISLVQKISDGFFKRVAISCTAMRECIVPLIQCGQIIVFLDFTFCEVEEGCFDELLKLGDIVRQIWTTRTLSEAEEDALFEREPKFGLQGLKMKFTFVVNPWCPAIPLFQKGIPEKYKKPLQPTIKCSLELYHFKIVDRFNDNVSYDKHIFSRTVSINSYTVKQRAPLSALPVGQWIEGTLHIPFAVGSEGLLTLNTSLTLSQLNDARSLQEKMDKAVEEKKAEKIAQKNKEGEQIYQKRELEKKAMYTRFAFGSFIEDNLKEYWITNPQLQKTTILGAYAKDLSNRFIAKVDVGPISSQDDILILNDYLFLIFKRLFLAHPLTDNMPFKVFSFNSFSLENFSLFISFLKEVKQIVRIVAPDDSFRNKLIEVLRHEGLSYNVVKEIKYLGW